MSLSPIRAVSLSIAFLLVAFAAIGAVAAASAVYPVTRSANRRYLVDARGTPFMIVGDSPQALMVNLTEDEAEVYLADRQAKGFNTIWVNLLATTYTGGRDDASTIDGIVPFTATLDTGAYDLTTPNQDYFAHVDRILTLAQDHGIQVLLDPIETGGFLSTLTDNGTDRAQSYGVFLGGRYASFPNIIWMSGNDFQDWPDPSIDAVVLAVAQGIAATDTRHLQTVELEPESSSLDDPSWTHLLGLNASYTYNPTYARLQSDYARGRSVPSFLVEANYELEAFHGPVTTPYILRKQEYWAMTSGATGQMYGNAYIWPFLSGWQDFLDTEGANEMQYLASFFASRPWYALIPDLGHSVLTGGQGTFASDGTVADNDYATAARTPDGRLIVVYTPTVRPLTVNMNEAGRSPTARWYDPTSGAYTAASSSTPGNHGMSVFTPPGPNAAGDGDWVLAIESTGSSHGIPGPRFEPRTSGRNLGLRTR